MYLLNAVDKKKVYSPLLTCQVFVNEKIDKWNVRNDFAPSCEITTYEKQSGIFSGKIRRVTLTWLDKCAHPFILVDVAVWRMNTKEHQRTNGANGPP